ncbi:hypothetical protein CCR85_00070, partial [Rhodothalassium salexigens]|uniref:OB-fold nucleic acid binding domain-containing protein n=1 Tax=Rhodothalassium salexigens TaxID=1086 RepID=UPI001F5C74F0
AALIAALHRRGVARPALETLAGADAFAGLGLDRRRALWAVRGLPEARPLPLFAAADMADSGVETGAADAGSTLPALSPGEQVVEDYQALHLSLKGHPVSFLRGFLAEEGASRARDLVRLGDGARVVVAGLVLVRQRPGSAKGVVFLTLEDESGVANAVIWPKVLEAQRPAVMGARLALVAGRVQRQGDVIHVVADRVEDRSGWLLLLCEAADALAAPLARGDEAGTDTAHTDDISAGASRAATSVAGGTVAGARTRPGHRPRSRQPKPPPDATWQRRLLARLHDRLPPPRAVHACDVRDLVPRSRDFH